MASHPLSALTVSARFTQPNDSSSYTQTKCTVKLNNLVRSFIIGDKLSIPSSRRYVSPKRRHLYTVTIISFSLPTEKRRESASKNVPKWSARSIKSFVMGELEARKLKYPKTGTEALLMGILVEGTSIAAKFLRENGITLFKVREETVKLLGKSDLYFFSPEHPPLTEPVQRALDWAIKEKLKSGESGEITTTCLLLGIWYEKESAGHKIMAALGFDDEKAKELAKFIDKEIVLSYK